MSRVETSVADRTPKDGAQEKENCKRHTGEAARNEGVAVSGLRWSMCISIYIYRSIYLCRHRIPVCEYMYMSTSIRICPVFWCNIHTHTPRTSNRHVAMTFLICSNSLKISSPGDVFSQSLLCTSSLVLVSFFNPHHWPWSSGGGGGPHDEQICLDDEVYKVWGSIRATGVNPFGLLSTISPPEMVAT